MIRKIIKINEEMCNGCGLCADACHEGAIAMIDGKAKLIREDYCDGLGNCLPVCPTGAISFEEREAPEFNEKEAGKPKVTKPAGGCQSGCPGTMARALASNSIIKYTDKKNNIPLQTEAESELMQWPVQIKLVPVNAPYFNNARLLIAADCVAYAYADFHKHFIRNHVTLIGCPKLDDTDYSQKLTEIIKRNDIKSITVARMEVPCCGGIEYAVKQAIINSGKMIPWQVKVISVNGNIIDK